MPGNRSLKQSDYMALAEFRYQIRRYVRVSEEAARQAAIEPQHHQLLLAVKGMREREKPRIAYLAEHLQIQHHSAVELVNRLAKKGLIVRIRGDEDRREVLVQLTARGERILGELTLHLRAELQTAALALVATLRKLTSRPRPVASSHTSATRSSRAVARHRQVASAKNKLATIGRKLK